MRSVLVLLLCFAPTLAAQHRVETDSLFSAHTQTWMKVRVLVPPSVPDSGAAVLYLLHGYTGSHADWTDRTDIETVVAGTDLVVVMPDGHNSFYIGPYERFIIDELGAWVEARYRIHPRRRGIAGLSMGGFGAIHLGLNNPDRFRFVGGLSSAVSSSAVGGDEASDGYRRIRPQLWAMLGPEGHPNRERYDFVRIVQRSDPATAPYVYLVHGIQDGFADFLPGHRLLTDQFRARGIRYEYHEVPGGHTWAFWDRYIGEVVRKMLNE